MMPGTGSSTKSSLAGITTVIQTQLMMPPDMGGQAGNALALPPEAFEYRWQAG